MWIVDIEHHGVYTNNDLNWRCVRVYECCFETCIVYDNHMATQDQFLKLVTIIVDNWGSSIKHDICA